MKEKIINIFLKLAEIGIVIWAIWGMWRVVTFRFPVRYLSEDGIKIATALSEKGINILLPELLFYFLSTILILYLLRKYEGKN